MVTKTRSTKTGARCITAITLAIVSVGGMIALAEAQEAGGRSSRRTTVPPEQQIIPGYRLTIIGGTRAAYRVKEQLLGINFPNDAVGLTQSVTGSMLLRPDGSVDSTQSKLTVDLRTLSSDQEHRDEYVNEVTLAVDKYPLAEFVPRRIGGLPAPLGYKGQNGIEIVGDMTLHGVTRELTWKGVVSDRGTHGRGPSGDELHLRNVRDARPEGRHTGIERRGQHRARS